MGKLKKDCSEEEWERLKKRDRESRKHKKDYTTEEWRKVLEKYREPGRLKMQRLRAQNPEHYKVYQREWCHNNNKWVSQRQHNYWEQYKLKNLEGYIEYWKFHNNKRKAFKRNCDINDLTLEEWRDLLEAFPRCYYCNATDKVLTMDHRQPLSRGGNHTLSNVAPCCLSCNCSKGKKTEEEFWTYLGYD